MTRRSVTTYGEANGTGKLSMLKREEFARHVADIPKGLVKITVAYVGKQRSLNSNAYQWLIYDMIAARLTETQGEVYDADRMHEVFKLLHNPVEVEIGGEIVVVGGSTASMSDSEHFDYNEKNRQWAMEKLDLYIPTPDEFERGLKEAQFT